MLSTDAPIDNQGLGEQFSPTDLLATALATYILTIMGITGSRGWSLEGSRADVDKHMTRKDSPRGEPDGESDASPRTQQRATPVAAAGSRPMPGQTQPGSTDQNQPELELTADLAEAAFDQAAINP